MLRQLVAPLALAIPLAAGAQDRPAPALAPDTLATVNVTVLRIPIAPADAPFAVASVGSLRAAAARPGFALDEVLSGVAGVQVDNRLNFALGERIAIRGLGARTQFGVRGVRVIVDGIPATFADGQTQLNNVDLATIGSAEVLRGPASALYGNAAGGVISLRSAPAPSGEIVPWGRAIYGSDALRHLAAGVGGTPEAATYSVSADRLDYGGYRHFSRARNSHLNAIGTYAAGRVALRLVANGVRYDAENPGALTDSLVRADRRAAYPFNVLQKTGERGEQGQAGIHMTLPLGSGALRVSGYALRRSLDNPIPPAIIALHRTAGGVRADYSVERVLGAGSVTALAGLESDFQRDDRRNWRNVRGSRGAITLDQLERVGSAAPFAQVIARAGRATMLGSLRYDSFRFAASDRLVTTTNPDDAGVRRMSALSPSIGVSVALARGVRVYANLATAFQTPTTTELANRPDGAGGFNPTLRPEHVRSREAGVKGSVASATFDLAAYDMIVTDELIPFEVPSAPGRQFYRNAGAARHRGIDGDVTVAVTPSLDARASVTVVDARYVAYSTAAASYAGRRVPGVAPRVVGASLYWHGTGGALIALEGRAQGRTPVNDANDASSPGYSVIDARGSFPVGRGSIFAGVRNVLDTRYNTSVVINAFGGRYYEPAAGRTVYAGVTLGR